MLLFLTFTPCASPVNISGNAANALQVPWVHPNCLFMLMQFISYKMTFGSIWSQILRAGR